MKLSDKQLLEIMQYAFVRMDGAWFLALARKFGKETAWEMDVEAWKQFSYIFGKKIERISSPIRYGRRVFCKPWQSSVKS
jgi:hypothetical protein